MAGPHSCACGRSCAEDGGGCFGTCETILLPSPLGLAGIGDRYCACRKPCPGRLLVPHGSPDTPGKREPAEAFLNTKLCPKEVSDCLWGQERSRPAFRSSQTVGGALGSWVPCVLRGPRRLSSVLRGSPPGPGRPQAPALTSGVASSKAQCSQLQSEAKGAYPLFHMGDV